MGSRRPGRCGLQRLTGSAQKSFYRKKLQPLVSQATFCVELKRNWQYYFYVTVLPTFLQVATTIAGMLLPIDLEGGYEKVLKNFGAISDQHCPGEYSRSHGHSEHRVGLHAEDHQLHSLRILRPGRTGPVLCGHVHWDRHQRALR